MLHAYLGKHAEPLDGVHRHTTTHGAPAFSFSFLQAGLVWFYAAKDVPFLVSVSVFTSWLLGFIGTLLLPADIVLTLLNGSHRWAARRF